MRGRVEIRLADDQTDDLPAFPAQLVGPIGGRCTRGRLYSPDPPCDMG
jgi:hypothetical protein